MKILQLVSSLGIGGAERFVCELAINQSMQGQQVTIIALKKQVGSKGVSYQQELLERLNKNDVDVIFAPQVSRFKVFTLFRFLSEVITSHRFDIIHSHLLVWSCLLHFCKFTAVNIFTQHTFRLRFPKLHKYFICRKVNSYIAICNTAKDSIADFIDEGNIYTIKNGIDTSKFANEHTRLKKDKLKLIMVSRIDSNKNHILALKCLQGLPPQVLKNLSLTIVGEGPEEDNLKQYCISNNLTNTVTFTGIRSDISELLNEHDLYLLLSFREGYSLALCEAFCSGIDLIASDVGGNHEIIEDGKYGYLIESNNIKQLEKRIVTFLNSEQLSFLDRQEAINKMDISYCAKKHIEHYSNLIDRRD